MESMIQAAHQHLADDSPSSRSSAPTTRRRCRTNQEDGVQVENFEVTSDEVKLGDHMESFPLVPLPVIAQLSIADLEKVEHGLTELLGSLMPHESDQQLARYATRQLTEVLHQLTQERAQERVFQMLRGDSPATLVPIGAPTLKKSSSASAAMKTRPTPVSESPKSGLPRRASSIQSEHWKSKKAAVEKARAMVQANAMKKTAASSTSFMVSTGENGSRKRRRPKRKRTPEEEAQFRALQLGRERENRRQAANQRLLARRELQAKRKQQHKKQKEDTRARGKDSEKDSGAKTKDRNDSSSDSESEASEVSNCSESDEANEKAILELEVRIEPLIDEMKSEAGDDIDVDENDRENAGLGYEDEGSEAPEWFSRSASRDRLEIHSENVNFETEKHNFPCEPSVTPETSEDKAQHLPDDDAKPQEDDIKSRTEAQANQIELNQEETISLNLQRFIASRAAAKLEQLQAERKSGDIAPPTLVAPTAIPATIYSVEQVTTALVSPSLRPEAGHYSVEEILPPAPTTLEDKTDGLVLDTSEKASPEPQPDPIVDEKQPSWIAEVRQSSIEPKTSSDKTLSLFRAPGAECKDYRPYFNNFHCILTAVFEQSRGTASTSSSSSSLYHRPVGANGEHTMRLQQKLYESWQSIMQDYATVFGPRIVAPEGMVPAAAAKPWAPHYRINSTARKEVSEIVTDALQRLGGGWEEHTSGLGLKTTWNLLWTWSKPQVERQTLLAWQKVNHFKHAKALTRKDCLKKHIGKYLAAGGRLRQAFDIIPPTFILPKEYVAFVQAFQERSERLRQSSFAEGKNIWIMKPVALSRGRGISLVNDLSQVIYGEQVVIQEYIAAPRLLDGFKFDLRLYVLVTSFNPLEAFLYDEGFVRLCTRKYEDSDISNIFVHLTNSSIQKDNEDAIAGSSNPIASVMKDGSKADDNEAAHTDAGGTKTTLAYLWRRLAAEGVDVDLVRRNIEEVVLKALVCGEDHIPFQVNSFDLLGYDILLDADLRPWLIEINSSPSMARDHDLDYQVKDAMMLDTLRVVDPLHFDRAKLAEVIARRQRDLEDEKRRPHAHTRHPREAEELADRQLNEDLTAILRGRVPRGYGEIPEHIGSYKRLCPHTTMHNQLVKLKRSCLRGGDRKV